MSEPGVLPRVNIVGTHITAASFEVAVSWLAEAVMARRAVFVSPATAYSVMLGRERPDYRAHVNQAAYVITDGMPLVWAVHWLGYTVDRVHGDDLMLACCERFPHWRHFLLGGASGQPEKVAGELRRRYPAIRICGHYATPVRPVPEAETANIIKAIYDTEAEVVWVGMGTPTQDDWMAVNVPAVKVPLIGVGSVFDMLAGRTRPAPEWMKRSGLQWLFRWMQEPRRLTRRYLLYNPLFIWHFLLQYVRVKHY
ncbi:MAG TPA: WecB/TagA/CpsF family glycosyltransferase [Anaerolineales bacterium]|nr:WecB/TagA/CpsF family glycosyltransferase [Anaerolineales bacterium]